MSKHTPLYVQFGAFTIEIPNIGYLNGVLSVQTTRL